MKAAAAAVTTLPGLNLTDPKAQRAYIKLMKDQASRQDLYRAIQFIQDNPWIQVLGGLVLVDFLRYTGVISKSKSSDLGLLIAGLGVAVNGGSMTASALAGLVGGTFEFFPDTPANFAGPPYNPAAGSPPGVYPYLPPSDFQPYPGKVIV